MGEIEKRWIEMEAEISRLKAVIESDEWVIKQGALRVGNLKHQREALGKDLASAYARIAELEGGPKAEGWAERMEALNFDACCALPEAQSLATFWQTRADELKQALSNLIEDYDTIHERYQEHVKEAEREAYPDGVQEEEAEAWDANCPCTWCRHRREARAVLMGQW